MAIIIFILLAVLPPLLGKSFWPKLSRARLYILAAIISFLILFPIHYLLNAEADPSGAFKSGQYIISVTSNGMEQLTGSFTWRLFQWGVINGDGTPSDFDFYLYDNFGIDLNTAAKYDPSDPSPAMLIAWLLLLSLIGTFFSKEKVTPEEKVNPIKHKYTEQGIVQGKKIETWMCTHCGQANSVNPSICENCGGMRVYGID